MYCSFPSTLCILTYSASDIDNDKDAKKEGRNEDDDADDHGDHQAVGTFLGGKEVFGAVRADTNRTFLGILQVMFVANFLLAADLLDRAAEFNGVVADLLLVGG